MGITVIQRSNARTRRLNPRLALVLAGGAVTGGAFKLGGLRALDDYLVSRKVVDFDIYVGLSAGAFLAAPLAAGITPAELVASMEGTGEIGEFKLLDVYFPNVGELVTKPLEYLTDLVTYFPRTVGEILVKSPDTVQRARLPIERWLAEPTLENLRRIASVVVEGLTAETEFPVPLDYLPSGLFDNRRIERFIRNGFHERGLTNSFHALYRQRGKELYIVAVNLDTAERVVFGHDEDSALTISEAVQATTALPGFYKPARIKGVDYIDGGVRRTANLDVAIEHGADLIVCYNPFRPFNNPVVRGSRRGEHGSPLANHGMLAVMNQVFRAMLHSRLHLALGQYREDPSFRGDIVLIEPTDTDETFFNMFPMNFWERRRAADHGYLSTTMAIDAHYETLSRVFERHGLAVSRRHMDASASRIRESLLEDPALLEADAG
ncbi:MAG: patatin-like phospholipase family protein [Thermodesulfobacteriota bacterium]